MTITPRQLITCLHSLPVCDPPAIPLTHQLAAWQQSGELTTDLLLARLPDIEVALADLNRIATGSRKAVVRCLALTPVPLPRIPPGF